MSDLDLHKEYEMAKRRIF